MPGRGQGLSLLAAKKLGRGQAANQTEQSLETSLLCCLAAAYSCSACGYKPALCGINQSGKCAECTANKEMERLENVQYSAK